MANALLKVNDKIIHEWANDVLTSIRTVAITPFHTVAITSNHTFLQGCYDVIYTYRHTNTTTVM